MSGGVRVERTAAGSWEVSSVRRADGIDVWERVAAIEEYDGRFHIARWGFNVVGHLVLGNPEDGAGFGSLREALGALKAGPKVDGVPVITLDPPPVVFDAEALGRIAYEAQRGAIAEANRGVGYEVGAPGFPPWESCQQWSRDAWVTAAAAVADVVRHAAQEPERCVPEVTIHPACAVDPTAITTLARIGYGGYGDETGGLTYDGRQMPDWEELPARTVKAWEAATRAIMAMVARCSCCGLPAGPEQLESPKPEAATRDGFAREGLCSFAVNVKGEHFACTRFAGHDGDHEGPGMVATGSAAKRCGCSTGCKSADCDRL